MLKQSALAAANYCDTPFVYGLKLVHRKVAQPGEPEVFIIMSVILAKTLRTLDFVLHL